MSTCAGVLLRTAKKQVPPGRGNLTTLTHSRISTWSTYTLLWTILIQACVTKVSTRAWKPDWNLFLTWIPGGVRRACRFMPCLFAKICLHKFAQKNLHAGTKRTSFDTPKLGDDLLEIRDSLVFGYSKFLDMRFSDSLPLTPQVCIFFSGFLVGWLVGSSAILPDGLW